MYTVHTDAPASLPKSWNAKAHKDGDCFYGWGETRRNKHICPRHTTIDAPTREEAEHYASLLVQLRYQVVITDREDWSVVVTGATTPIYYLASHEH